MKRALCVLLLAIGCARAEASVLYQQPAHPNGGYFHSSWWDPDGSNYDEYVWDRFILAADADIDTVTWRGTYDPAYGGDTPVVNFWVGVYGSAAGGSQPDVAHPPLVEYETGGNAGQTYAGVFGGMTMYDYRFRLPVPFHATAGVKYWIQIEAWQNGFPGWSIAAGTNGDGSHFRCQHNNAPLADVPTGCWFTTMTGDAAFTLMTRVPTGIELGSGSAARAFALESIAPNPSRGDRWTVSFRLEDAAPAVLSLFDVRGRLVETRGVGALGAGSHAIEIVPSPPLEPGTYFARLVQGDESSELKLIVAR